MKYIPCAHCAGNGKVADPGLPVQSPEMVASLLSPYANEDREHFIAVFLNQANNIIGEPYVAHIGTVNTSLASTRETFIEALKRGAVNIILAHNHPSGTLEPSSMDETITQHFVDAGRAMDLTILDHVIVSSKGFYSFREKGKMPHHRFAQ